jgi:two-component system, chemotaxis family, sensor kinase CheA
VENR